MSVPASADYGGDQDLASSLYREAQEEITSLRTELYGTRRKEWEAREALTKAKEELDHVRGALSDLQHKSEQLQAAAADAEQLRERTQELERAKADLEAKAAQDRRAAEVSEAEAAAEAAARRRAEEAAAKANSERSRLQRQRDEAQSQLRLAVKRAEEAEEEQCRTEEEAAQCRSELAALREGSPAARPGGGFDEAELRRELDSERSHVASLMAALRQAKAEAAEATETAAKAAGSGAYDSDSQREELDDRSRALESREAQLAAAEVSLQERERTLQQAEAALAQRQASASAEAEATAAKHRPEGKPPGSTPLPDESATAQRVQALESTVARLKLVRDKLLQEMDEQSAIAEALYAENTALAEGLSQQRMLSANWELQAQDGMLKAEQLKGMLEESASWQMQGQGAAGEESSPESRIVELEGKLLAEQAKVADLDLQVRALTAELTKACQHTGELGRSMLPVLTAIESRVEQLVAQSSTDGEVAA
eukprot:jgi/Tetstr1/423404/TSEL_014085.t1